MRLSFQYVVMIDAGSTSSKFSVYEWPDWPWRTNGFVDEIEYDDTSELLMNLQILFLLCGHRMFKVFFLFLSRPGNLILWKGSG